MIVAMMMIPVELENLTHGAWAVPDYRKPLVGESMLADRDEAETAGRADHEVGTDQSLEPGPRPLMHEHFGTEMTMSGNTTLQRKR